jgi:hypothetical protein
MHHDNLEQCKCQKIMLSSWQWKHELYFAYYVVYMKSLCLWQFCGFFIVYAVWINERQLPNHLTIIVRHNLLKKNWQWLRIVPSCRHIPGTLFSAFQILNAVQFVQLLLILERGSQFDLTLPICHSHSCPHWPSTTWSLTTMSCVIHTLFWSPEGTIFSLLSKNESRPIKSPACLCVCVSVSVCTPPLITFEPIGGFSWNLVGRWYHWRWPRSHIL